MRRSSRVLHEAMARYRARIAELRQKLRTEKARVQALRDKHDWQMEQQRRRMAKQIEQRDRLIKDLWALRFHCDQDPAVLKRVREQTKRWRKEVAA